jgi:hypothetical protein
MDRVKEGRTNLHVVWKPYDEDGTDLLIDLGSIASALRSLANSRTEPRP